MKVRSRAERDRDSPPRNTDSYENRHEESEGFRRMLEEDLHGEMRSDESGSEFCRRMEEENEKEERRERRRLGESVSSRSDLEESDEDSSRSSSSIRGEEEVVEDHGKKGKVEELEESRSNE